jgi:hypothetical protein
VSREVLRRRLLRAGVVPLVLALLFALKVGVMLGADRSARASYENDDLAASDRAFGVNRVVNLLEPWVSSFGSGTARYRLSDYEGAVDALTDALASAPPEHECRVRTNLALAHEAYGDELAVEDPAAAGEQWRLGSVVIEEGGCFEEAGGGGGPGDGPPQDDDGRAPGTGPRDDARALAARLRNKVTRNEERQERARDRQEELDRRNDRGERIRRDEEQGRVDEENRKDAEEDGGPLYAW